MRLFLKVLLAAILSLACWQPILANCVTQSTGYMMHSELGRIYKAGEYVQGTEGYAKTKINHLGMRNEGIEEDGKAGNSILVLGDSYTEAFQVDDDSTYTKQLEVSLRSFGDNRFHNISVVNAGRSGASPAHYIHLATYYKALLSPQTVVIQLNEGDFTNDIDNQQQNFYVQYQDGTYATVYNANYASSNAWLQKFPQMKDWLEISVVRRAAEQIRDVYNPQKLLKQKEADKNYDSIIDWTLSTLKNQYPNLVVIYLPNTNYEQIDEETSAIETQLDDSMIKHEIPYINMRKQFISYFKETKQPAHGFNNTKPGSGHTNAIGHKLIADSLTYYFENGVFQ